MKKIIVAIFALTLVFQVSAQKFGGGLEGGLTYSWLNVDSKVASAEKGLLGFTYGAFLDMNITDNFTLTSGFNILKHGGTIAYQDSIILNWDNSDHGVKPGAEVSYKIQYIEIPISIKGKTQEIGYITYFGRLGINPAFAIKARADVEGTAYNQDLTKVADLSDLNIEKNRNLINIGWHVGGGIEYSLGGSTAIIAELLFTQNFISMTKDNITLDSNSEVAVKPNMIVLKAGIKF